ncbi:hypothetical protein [Erythrobacter sp. MTPC3]|uniref:hypothetical protein n=1 Tax=Erythrobacter sp. MTPC3 TaxID=3056564 RepID=UPI0036F282F0
MRHPSKSAPILLTAIAATSLSLAACTTEPDEVAETPLDEATVTDADAAAVGIPEKQGEASPETAVPEASAEGAMPEERGSGAEPTVPIED